MELSKNIKVVRPEAKAIYPYSNSVYVDDDVTLVIDAGAGGKAYAEVNPERIDILLLTHFHFDHTHCAELFTNASIQVGKEEARLYTDAATFTKNTGYLEWPKLMGKIEFKNDMANFPYPDDVLARPGFKQVTPGGDFANGTVITMGKTKVTAIHTPGHTRGHYAFWFEKEGVLFSGDLDLSPRGPWYADGTSDVDEIIASVKKIIDIDPAILVTSHRRVFDRKWDNIRQEFKDYLNIILIREEKIHRYLNEPRSIEDIVDKGLAYTESVNFGLNILFWNKVMVLRHLERLVKMGQVQETDEGLYIRA